MRGFSTNIALHLMQHFSSLQNTIGIHTKKEGKTLGSISDRSRSSLTYNYKFLDGVNCKVYDFKPTRYDQARLDAAIGRRFRRGKKRASNYKYSILVNPTVSDGYVLWVSRNIGVTYDDVSYCDNNIGHKYKSESIAERKRVRHLYAKYQYS